MYICGILLPTSVLMLSSLSIIELVVTLVFISGDDDPVLDVVILPLAIYIMTSRRNYVDNILIR